jgi:hypothetical protein
MNIVVNSKFINVTSLPHDCFGLLSDQSDPIGFIGFETSLVVRDGLYNVCQDFVG